MRLHPGIIFMRALFTFVSAQGGWVWLAEGGARKLRHILTRMCEYPFLDHSSDHSFKACSFLASVFLPGQQITTAGLSVTSLNEVAAPPPPSHTSRNKNILPGVALDLTCQCQSSFKYCWRWPCRKKFVSTFLPSHLPYAYIATVM